MKQFSEKIETYLNKFLKIKEDSLSRRYIELIKTKSLDFKIIHTKNNETRRLPEDVERTTIIPKEWFKEYGIPYEEEIELKKENTIYLKHKDYIFQQILLLNHSKYFKETNGFLYHIIKERFRRLLLINKNSKNKSQEDIRKLIYYKIRTEGILQEWEYKELENILKNHYENKRREK